jgi:hypothetical protein
VSVWYPAFGLGQLFTNDSNKDKDVLQLEFIKEEPDLIDLYESDDYSQRARRKIKKENTEVIDISDDSDSQVLASLAPSRTSMAFGMTSIRHPIRWRCNMPEQMRIPGLNFLF